MATILMRRTYFRLEKTWMSFVPRRAPMPAPMGMQPVRIPLAASAPNVIEKIFIIYLNGTVLMYTKEYPK